MPYSACIFDLDGTLADTLHSIAHFGNGTLEAFGYPPIDPIEYKQLVGNGADLLMRRMLARVGAKLSEEELKRFRAEYDRRYADDPMALVGAYPGLPYVLPRLRESGMKLGVLSNKPDDMTRAIVAGLYPGIFHAVHGQREGIPTKPDPAAVLALAEELGAAPGGVLYIGDSGVDMPRTPAWTPAGCYGGSALRRSFWSMGPCTWRGTRRSSKKLSKNDKYVLTNDIYWVIMEP